MRLYAPKTLVGAGRVDFGSARATDAFRFFRFFAATAVTAVVAERDEPAAAAAAGTVVIVACFAGRVK